MLFYEIKKVFVKVSNRIAILTLLVVLGIICYLSITGVKFVNQEGRTEIGVNAVQELKKQKNKWVGELTEEKIAAVIAENRRINETKEYQSEEVEQNNIAYGWKQGISDIRSLLIASYGKFRQYDYYLPDSLVMDDAKNFYNNRILNLKEWLATEANTQFSEEEKGFLVHKYESLKIPLHYEYSDGWKQLLENAPTILMIMVFVIGFLVSNIFPSEIQLKADSIFYSSRFGRNKAILAKIKAGILITTIIYWIIIILFSIIVLGILGFEGADCAIQTSTAGWKSFYNITYFQEYIIVIIGGYIGTVFIMMSTMLVSAQTKSAILAVITPFILVFVPSFLSGSSNNILTKILGLLPDQLLQMNVTLSYFNLYKIGAQMVGACEILVIIYSAGIILLYPVLYYINKKIAKS